MGYRPFKVNVIKVLEATKYSNEQKDKLRSVVVEPEFKQLFGIRLVDRIVNRTRDENLDKNNKPFPAYSSSYKKSLVFSIYGKSNDVDLTLTGAMLASLDYEYTKQLIIIGVSPDEEGKAEGHIDGSYGGKPNSKRRRDFLGVKESEVKNLMEQSLKSYMEDSIAEILV